MDNVGKETQGGSLRGFVIARKDNYLREATPSKLESWKDLFVDSLYVQKTYCQEKLGWCKICITFMAKNWMKIGIKVWGIKLCPNLTIFKQLEMSWRLKYSNGVTLKRWICNSNYDQEKVQESNCKNDYWPLLDNLKDEITSKSKGI